MEEGIVAYIASQELIKTASLLPSNINRSTLVHSLVQATQLFSPNHTGWIRRLQVIEPRPATYQALAAYHTRDYLDYIFNQPKHGRAADNQDKEFGLEDDCPSFVGLQDYVQLVAGASLTAAHLLRKRKVEIAICWDGGRHHAQKSNASGFCYVADCVLAILALKRPEPLEGNALCFTKPRIMYLDLDLHFSDAVSQTFYTPNRMANSNQQVLTLSIHHTSLGFFPPSPLAGLVSVDDVLFDPMTLSLPLRHGASDQTFEQIWPMVEQVKDAFAPDYIVVQCGVDGLAGDPCATWNWSLGASDGSLGWCVERIVKWAGGKLFLGGGGYHHPNAARSWTYLTALTVQKKLSLELDIPDHAAFPLYGPSFTLDVPPGNMQDKNGADYILRLKVHFAEVTKMLLNLRKDSN